MGMKLSTKKYFEKARKTRNSLKNYEKYTEKFEKKKREEDTDGGEVILIQEKRIRLENDIILIESESKKGNRVGHSPVVDKPVSPESGNVCLQTDLKARDQMNIQLLKIRNKVEIKTSTIVLK